MRLQGAGWTSRLRQAASGAPPEPTLEAEALLSRWQAEVDPGERGLFARRLARDGLSREQALAAVSGPPPGGAEPAWWPQYRECVGAFDRHRVEATTDEEWLQAVADLLPARVDRGIPFAHLLWPVAAEAWQRLSQAQAPRLAAVDPPARDDLQAALLSRLSECSAPCLSHLMWEAEPWGRRFLAQHEEVPDDLPRARYAAFCRAQAGDGLSAVLCRFPVLGGLLATVVRQWHEATAELLDRLARDRQELESRLGLPAGMPLRRVRAAAGDTHQDGRAVCILGFGDTSVVYKPRSVALEALYARQAAALDRLAPGDPLLAAAVLDRGEYGYMEYVAGAPCTTPAEWRRFYWNAGRTLALLHALAATDCHHENLVAAATQLVPVDAETLFEARGSTAEADGGPTDTGPPSVLNVGMLPVWLWFEGRRTAVDISALGAGSQPAGEGTGAGWRAVNTDLMVRGVVESRPGRPASVPTTDGSPGPVTAHVDELAEGFADVYRLLAGGKEAWLRELRECTAGMRRRLVVRPTYVYASLLGASVAPEALVSAASRGLVLERLTRAHLGDEAEPCWPLAAAEMEALGRLDVPFFQVPLHAAAGRRTEWLGGSLPGWPAEDSFAAATARLAQLGEADLRWQTALLRAAVAASAFRMSPPATAGEPTRSQAAVPESGAAGRACLVAVVEAAVTVDGRRTWTSLSLLPDGIRANLQPLGPGLYDGRLGLACALYAWADAGGGEDGRAATAAAAAALAPLLEQLESSDAAATARAVTRTGPGMSGVGGLLRGLAFLRESGYGEESAIRSAEAAVLRALLPSQLEHDRGLDQIGGAAGIVAPLARRLGQGEDARAERLLRAAAGVLVRRQDAATGGWWTLPGTAPLTGLAHGASGIALALVEAGIALQEPEYLAAAMRGLAYEATTYDAAARNWPDHRATARGGFMLGWCAGAPGIALTRMRLLQLLPGAAQAASWREELRAAAETTARAPLLAADHLCCGNLGRVAVLRTLAAASGTPDEARLWRTAANGIVAAVLERADEPLPRTMLGRAAAGIPLPGLMSGLSGAGLVLLDDDPARWVLRLLT